MKKKRVKTRKNGDGSILDYGTSYKVQLTVYDAYGKPHRPTKSGFTTKKAAEEYRRKAVALLVDHPYTSIKQIDEAITGKHKIEKGKTADTVTVQQLWDDICSQRAENIKRGVNKNNQKATLKENVSDMRWDRLSIFFATKRRVGHNPTQMETCKPRMYPILRKPWRKITVDDIEAVFARCPVQSGEVHRDLRALCNMMALYYQKTYGVKYNPWDNDMIRIQRRKSEVKINITPLPDAVHDLCRDYAEDDVKFASLSRSDQVAVAMILILCYSGMRISELQHVKPENVDLDARRIRDAGVKTASSVYNDIQFLVEATNLIYRFILGPEGNIFAAYSRHGLSYMASHLCRHIAEIDDDWDKIYAQQRDLYDNIHLHQCRHWAAVHICESVGEGGIGAAQQFLRHTNSSVTHQVYLWLDGQKTRDKIKAAGDIDGFAFTVPIRDMKLSENVHGRRGKTNKYQK